MLISCMPNTPDTAGVVSRNLLDKACGKQLYCSPSLFINVVHGRQLFFQFDYGSGEGFVYEH